MNFRSPRLVPSATSFGEKVDYLLLGSCLCLTVDPGVYSSLVIVVMAKMQSNGLKADVTARMALKMSEFEADTLTASIKANLAVDECSGANERLFVVADESCRILSIPLVKCRVRWRDDAYSYTAFMRSRNLVSTPPNSRGYLCLFHRPDDAANFWRLGVIGNLCLLFNRTVTVQEWIGPTTIVGGCFVPSFLCIPGVAAPFHFDAVKSHFQEVTLPVDIEQPPDLIFVNMVSTHDALSLPSGSACTNPRDSCFQMSQYGPDIMIEPSSLPVVQNEKLHGITGRWKFDIPLARKVYGGAKKKSKSKGSANWSSFRSRHSFDLLPTQTYVRVDRGAPQLSQPVVDKVKNHFAVPYIGKNGMKDLMVEFGYVTRAVWMVRLASTGCSVVEHNRWLRSVSVYNLTTVVGRLDPEFPGGSRINVANTEEVSMNNAPHQRMSKRVLRYEQVTGVGPGSTVARLVRQRQVRMLCCSVNASHPYPMYSPCCLYSNL